MVEMLIAVLVISTCLLVFLSVAQMSYRFSGQSRNRVLANILAQNLIEEIAAHPYGQPPRPEWKEHKYFVVVEGRPVEARFQVDMQASNGSFFGKDDSANFDVLKVTITWSEPNDRGSQQQSLVFEVTTGRTHAF